MSRRTTALVFLALTVLFGSSFPGIEVGLAVLPPLTFATARYGVSAVCLFAFVLVRGRRWRPPRGDWASILSAGVFLIGGTGLTFVGQQFTTAGTAAIIVSLSPVATVLLGWLLLPEERLSRRGLVGVLVGLLGVAIVVAPGSGMATPETTAGRLLILAATLSVTLGTVLLRRFEPTLSTPALTGWAMAVGALLLAIASVAVGESLPATLSARAIGAVLYLGVAVGAVAFVAFFWLIERVGPLEANLVAYTAPVVSLAVGWTLLDEPVVPTALVGFGLIAAGFASLKERELAAELARFRFGGR